MQRGLQARGFGAPACSITWTRAGHDTNSVHGGSRQMTYAEHVAVLYCPAILFIYRHGSGKAAIRVRVDRSSSDLALVAVDPIS
jgi:hypothetical protein